MSPWEILAIGAAGVAAGFINALAGSGTLVTFPTLLALGVPPVVANVSNNVGLVPGAVAGAYAWRRELRGQRDRLLRLGSASLLGGILGATLLLVLPSEAFAAIVPVLVALGIVLVAIQPMVNRRVAAAGERSASHEARWLWPAVFGTGTYGGYFGAAQGILLIAALGTGTHDTIHRSNALKNVLAGVVNGVAAVIFIVAADIDWVIAGVIGVGSIVGAQIGGHTGRRLSPALLRGFILLVGITALGVFLVRG